MYQPIFIVFFLLSLFPGLQVRAEQNEFKYDLVICALFQNEELYMKEWIEFHQLVGVQHFYLFNNSSDDHSIEILQPYIEKKLVDLIPFPLKTNTQAEYLHLLQIPAYKAGLELAKKSARWAAFIDLDEFLFPIQQDNLVDILDGFQSFGGVVANWQVYGTSKRNKLRPGELLIEALMWKAPKDSERNHFFKSIVQPSKVLDIGDPHSFHFIDGYYAVNTAFEAVIPGIGKHRSIVIDQIRINHYWFGTMSWFVHNKLPIKLKWGHIKDRSEEWMKKVIAFHNQVYDPEIARFIPFLQKKIQEN